MLWCESVGDEVVGIPMTCQRYLVEVCGCGLDVRQISDGPLNSLNHEATL